MVSHSLFSLIHEVNKLVYKNVPESEVWEPSSMDPKSLQVLQRAVRKLGAALETPGDTVQRIGYLVIGLPHLYAVQFAKIVIYRVFSRLLCELE